MFCNKCKKDLTECTCPDLKERLESLKNSPNIVFRMCKICGRHYAVCKCESPKWTTNLGDSYLPDEFRQ